MASFLSQGNFNTVSSNRTGVERLNNGSALTLDRLGDGEEAILDRIDLPEDDVRRLMELGFLPGTLIVAARRSPFGDPRVFRVDGSEVALRRETAEHLYIRSHQTVTESGHEQLP
jgi:ferrous iron transport protein A